MIIRREGVSTDFLKNSFGNVEHGLELPVIGGEAPIEIRSSALL
jgi:hypothetical protein